MPTTKTTTQTGQFDPTAMAGYQGISGALGGTLPGFIQNPFSSSQFGLEQQMGTRQAQGLGQTGMSDLLRNMMASGMSGGASSPAGLEMQQNQSRANTGLQANLGFLAPYMAALQRQQYAMGLGSQYRPLQTGQTQTEKTSGLGTWLPQVAQMGMGLLTGLPTGGGGIPGMAPGQTAGGTTAGLAGANPSAWFGGPSVPNMGFGTGSSPAPPGGLPPWMGGGM